MNFDDFELTSEGTESSQKKISASEINEKIKAVTKSGNLIIPKDEIWQYWSVLKSENLFERLFLDIENHDSVSNQTIKNHYSEINAYLERWRERESTGISFTDSHKGNTIRELKSNLDEAYELIKHKSDRDNYIQEWMTDKKNKLSAQLMPVIKAAFADKVMTLEEKRFIYEEGIKAGLTLKEIDLLIKQYMDSDDSLRDDSDSASLPKKETSNAAAIFTPETNVEKEINNRPETVQVTPPPPPVKKKGGALRNFIILLVLGGGIYYLYDLFLTKTIDSKQMVFVEGGNFYMGCTSEQGSDCDDDEKNVRLVSVSNFYIAKYEVTQALWASVMDSEPAEFKGKNNPVDNVSWLEVLDFCNKLSMKEGLTPVYRFSNGQYSCDFSADGYRLPTEAEWEFAARGGKLSSSNKYSGDFDVNAVSWYGGNSDNKTHSVGEKKPNELGIYDMSGNVWEWCWDWYNKKYPDYDQTDPYGPDKGISRTLRGGAWSYAPLYSR